MRDDSQGQGTVPGDCSETSFLFLSAVTDGIPEPSEGTVNVALKLERMDGIDLVSQRRGALSGFALQKGLYCAHGVARSLFPTMQVNAACSEAQS